MLTDEVAFGAEVLEKLVAAGYRRLGEDERRIMEALAVFDRPVDETAITYLLHPWFPGLDVRAGLRRLASSYFVSASRITGEYSLHPLDRAYAYHQLPDDERTDAYNQRNLELRAADFYAGLRKPESAWKTIDDLAPQLAEFEHRVRAGDYESACHVLEPINDYLYVWGHYAFLVELRERLSEYLTDPGLQETNLGSLGRAYHALWQIKRSIESFEQALAIARKIGNRQSEGAWLSDLGRSYRGIGQVKQAIELLEQALAIAREIGGRWQEEGALGRLGQAYGALGQVEQALECFKEALDVAHEIGDRHGEGVWLGCLGQAYGALGQFERGIEISEKSLAIAREFSNRWIESYTLGFLGHAYRHLGRVEWAIESYEQALDISREISDPRGQRQHLLGLGKALLTAGELPTARGRCAEALALDVPATSYQAALALGIVLLHQRDPAAGETFTDAAARCRAMLDKTVSLYEPRYALAAALVGQAVCDPRWADEGERARLLAPALAEYRRALENCAAPGVVRDALRDLEMIRAAGIEGLEPAFELLQGEA